MSVFAENTTIIPKEVEPPCGDYIDTLEIDIANVSQSSPPSSDLTFIHGNEDFMMLHGELLDDVEPRRLPNAGSTGSCSITFLENIRRCCRRNRERFGFLCSKEYWALDPLLFSLLESASCH